MESKKIRVAKELVKLAKSLMITADGDGEKEENFDDSELKKLVSDINSAADKAISESDSGADKMEELVDDVEEGVENQLDNANQVLRRNLRYAKRYSSRILTASERRIYKGNVLAEDIRKASIKVAKYLRKAKIKMADFWEGFNKNRRPMIDTVKEKIKNALQYLVDKINAFIDWVKNMVQEAKDAGKKTLGMLAKGALFAAVAAIVVIVGPVALAVYGIVKVFGVAKDAVLKVFDKIKEAFSALKDAIAKGLDAITTALGLIANVVTVIPQAIYELITEKSDDYLEEKEKELE